MEQFAKVNTDISQRILSRLNIRKALPFLAMLGGGGVAALALGADLLGGSEGFGPLQIKLAWVGLAIFLLGATLDLALGQRSLLQWFNLLILDKQSVIKFLGITIQLGLLVLVSRQFVLESQAFYHNVMLLTFFGFLVHHFLPQRSRLYFFLLLSFAAIAGIFGFLNGAWLIGIGLGLIGVCHLPISFAARVGLLLAISGLLIVLRIGWIQASWSGVVLPILASMFMFRLIVYLYDLKHQKEPVNVLRTLSYFFLFPNLVFPLFPVVDYKTFCRTYYNDDRYRIYQTGVNWMFRGILHLVLYRFVNYYLVIPSENVANMTDLVRYVVSNFMLLLRVSGQFHLVVGMLHLFGFNLPEIMNRYWLAASFNDFWRRANIYWKDFMQKVFFYPLYFRLRKLGAASSLVVATLFVFALTWFFHAYQWFWIRGSFFFSVPDMLFWAIFGLLVTANSLFEAKFGRKRSLGERAWTFADALSRTFRTVGTFAAIGVLWSLWISPSVTDWFSLWSAAGVTWEGVVKFIPTLLVVVAAFFVAIIVFEKISWNDLVDAGANAKLVPFFRAAAVPGVVIALLYLIGHPGVPLGFGEQASNMIKDLKTNKLNFQDAALLEKGYYENLTNVNQFNTQLWELYMKKPHDWIVISQSKASRLTGDFLGLELVPSTSTIFLGKKLSTNRWGMRDRDYEQTPPPNTYRIALLGGSLTMGSGVEDNEICEWVLEERLNRENQGGTYAKYEILNFSVGGYGPIRRMMTLENKALPFQPNAVFFVAHPRDYHHAIHLLVLKSRAGVDIPYDYLKEIVHKAGVDKETSEAEAARRLKPYGDEIVAWSYRRTMEICKERGILPVWILMPSGVGMYEPEDFSKLTRFAGEAGFIVLDLSHIFDNQEAESLRVAPWDWHPNAKGHRLIAHRLHDALLEKGIIRLSLASGNGTSVDVSSRRSRN